MKVCVVYFSLEGNTRLVAQRVAARLDADLIELRPVKPYPTGKAAKYLWGGKSSVAKEQPALEPYDFDAAQYDTVVLGTPLWAWNVAPPLRTFLAAHDLSGKRVAAFISCMGGGTDRAFGAIRTGTRHEALAAELTLVNPLANRDTIDTKIDTFCEKLKG